MNEEYHSRWEEEHRRVCQDCHEAWLDACYEMEVDAKLDAMSEMEDEE